MNTEEYFKQVKENKLNLELLSLVKEKLVALEKICRELVEKNKSDENKYIELDMIFSEREKQLIYEEKALRKIFEEKSKG